MYGRDWINGAESLRKKALEFMSSYENRVYIEDYFSEEYCLDEFQFQLNDYAQMILSSNDYDEEHRAFAVAALYGIVDYEDSGMDDAIDINISKFEVLEAIINSYMYHNSQIYMNEWSEENQILLIINLLKVYFGPERQRVLDIQDEMPWSSMGNNVMDIFSDNMLDVFSGAFEGSEIDDDSIRLFIKLYQLNSQLIIYQLDKK